MPMALSSPLGVADTRILAAVYRYDYLTPLQVCRLLYAPTSRTYVWQRLSTLATHGYLLRVRLGNRHTVGGRAPSVYTLSSKGLSLFAQTESPSRRRPRLAEEQVKAKNDRFLPHTLAVNDFLISAELLCRSRDDFVLAGLVTERDSARAPVPVVITGKPYAVAVDGWLDIHIRGQMRACICLELDRDTERVATWKKKVHALLAFASGPYQRAFRTELLTVAVVATPGTQRRDELCRWTEQELTRLGEKHEADMFRFLAGEPTAYTPEALFLAPVWLCPFGQAPVALIDLAQP